MTALLGEHCNRNRLDKIRRLDNQNLRASATPTTTTIKLKPLLLLTTILLSVIAIGVPTLVISEDTLFQSKNEVLASKVVSAIKHHETKGKCHLKGGSGERGCYQFQSATWRGYQKTFLGTTTLAMTEENEDKVMLAMAKTLLDKGKTPADIAKFHNSGNFGKCSSGINRWGVRYDSCAYIQAILSGIKKV